MADIFRIMGVKFLGPPNIFFIKWMLNTTLNIHHYTFIHQVADYRTNQTTRIFRLGHECASFFTVIAVRTRAISRRTVRKREVLANCPVACCIRNLNCSSKRTSN
uniref:Uncharacterized protein n=1 Tax=mine drainage metagenome TaxID=410659 RepID=E6QH12_9ZZZZ